MKTLLRSSVLLCAASACLISCGHTRSYTAAPAPPESIYVVEVVGGQVATTRPDGQPWDLQDTSTQRHLAGFRLETPVGAISFSVTPVRVEDTQPNAPDVAVTISLNGRRIETPVSRNSFTPSWGYRFLIDPLMDPDGVVTLQVADEDGDHLESMGAQTIPLRELLNTPQRQLGPFGSVQSLQLTVTRQSPQDFAPFETRPIELSSELGGWLNTGIQVYSGMHLAIAADGRVRVSRLMASGWGPEGVSDPNLRARWQGYNVEGFEAAPHGALIACVVDPRTQSITQRLVVGDGLLTRLDGSGILLLGVNDTDPRNNAGAFQVRVGGGARMPVEAVARPMR